MNSPETPKSFFWANPNVVYKLPCKHKIENRIQVCFSF